jgi:hypothetical protein
MNASTSRSPRGDRLAIESPTSRVRRCRSRRASRSVRTPNSLRALTDSVVVVDRRAQRVLVKPVAGGEAIEAVQQDDRAVVRGASLFALLPVFLPTQAFVLSAHTAAVEPQRCQARSRHAGNADRAGDGPAPDSVARHLSTNADRTRRLELAALPQALRPKRRTRSRTLWGVCVDGGPLSRVTPYRAPSDAR